MTRILFASLVLLGSCASGADKPVADGSPQPVAQPAPVEPAHAGAAGLTGASSVEQILDALHARGVGLNDFVSDVSLAEMDALTGDTTTFKGKVWYQNRPEGDARIRVIFDEKRVGKNVRKDEKMEYLLASGWLHEWDHKKKMQIDRQVLKPGEKLNVLKLGEGPFPLPIGQPREEVLKQFDVAKAEPKPEDPAGTVHVLLTPKAGTRFAKKFKTFDVWVDTKSNFPTKIETSDPRQITIKTTELGNIAVNAGVKDEQFALGEPGPGWSVRSEALEE